MTTHQIDQAANELGLTMAATFIPFSQSRNRAEKNPSLNWLVEIRHNGRAILSTDYSAGSGHAPSYKQGNHTVVNDTLVRWECEHGYRAHWSNPNNGAARAFGSKPILPELRDVLCSLASEADVLDAGGFEQWASNLGYDTDSRKAETIYHACLDIALKLRAALGDDGLRKLREACQDY